MNAVDQKIEELIKSMGIKLTPEMVHRWDENIKDTKNLTDKLKAHVESTDAKLNDHEKRITELEKK